VESRTAGSECFANDGTVIYSTGLAAEGAAMLIRLNSVDEIFLPSTGTDAQGSAELTILEWSSEIDETAFRPPFEVSSQR
jgi:hypothetical protein